MMLCIAHRYGREQHHKRTFAKWQGAGRVIAKVNNEGLCSIVPENELDCIISPKTITANQILTFVRAMDCSPEGSNVETVHQMVGGKIEAIEFPQRAIIRCTGGRSRN